MTPPTTDGILPGATRTWVLTAEAVGDLDLAVEEAELSPDDLVGADEAFLTSSVAGILPLAELDGQAIAGGRPGTRTIALREARERWIDEQSLAAVEAGAVGAAPSASVERKPVGRT